MMDLFLPKWCRHEISCGVLPNGTMKVESRKNKSSKLFNKNRMHQFPVVVIVHDDPVQLSKISLLVGMETAEVHSFRSVGDALQFMSKSGPPQLIITALNMPGTDGSRFCKMVRSLEFFVLNEVPILVVSAICGGMDAHSITTGLGVNDFIGIPYNVNDFRKKVCRLLKGVSSLSVPGFLLLNGDAVFSRSLKKAMRAGGYAVHIARRQADLWALFYKHRPLGVVLDSVLAAELNGTMIDEIKRHNPLCAVVVVSEKTSGEEAAKWIEAGANAYIGKKSTAKEIVGVCESSSRERTFLGIKARQELDGEAHKSTDSLYHALFEAAGEAMLVFEEQSGNIVEANTAATVLYRCTRTELRGMRFGELAAAEIGTCQESDNGGNLMHAWHRRKSGGGFAAEIVVRPFSAHNLRLNVAVVRDLTDRMVADKAKEQARVPLQARRARSPNLPRLLHICANCKKIKDDTGLWTGLELYLSGYNGTEFSHSICPNCVKKLYPDHSE
jgi:PAS domain S-box-containing protein